MRSYPTGPYPDSAESWRFQELFSASPEQVHHDYIISHVLDLLREYKDKIIFAGGTALSRTYLPGHRLSEDIDLWTSPSLRERGSVRALGTQIHKTLTAGLPSRVGSPKWDIALGSANNSTVPSVYRLPTGSIRIQLLDSTRYPSWPTIEQEIDLRYCGFSTLQLVTLTPQSFVCAKTLAWVDSTRNAPRDLYDLWALAKNGYINQDSAALYAKCGPSGRPPSRLTLPHKAPTEQEWEVSLSHQCGLQTSANEAWKTVVDAWEKAATLLS